MKNIITMLLVIIGFTAGAQNFEKYFPYLGQSLSSAVFINEDGYVMTGFTKDGNNQSYLYVVKTNLNGDTIWCKKMNEVNDGSYSYLRSYTEDANGNIYLAVNYTATADIVKMSPEWDIVWKKKISTDFQILNITNSKDNNLLFSGLENDTIYTLYKMDTVGTILWQSANLPMFDYTVRYSNSITEMDDNSIIVNTIVSSWYTDGISSSVISALDDNGNLISSVLYYGYVMCELYGLENELFSAYYNTLFGPPTNNLIRFLPDGKILSEVPLKIPVNSYVSHIIPSSENNYLVVGSHRFTIDSFPYYLEKVILNGLNANGDSLWSGSLGNAREIWFNSMDVKKCADAGYVITGAAILTEDYIPFLAKTDSLGNFSSLGINNKFEKTAIRVYPNPATENVVFETDLIGKGFISITDIHGRPVAEVPVTSDKTVWDASNVAPGVYLYRFNNGTYTSSGKFLILK